MINLSYVALGLGVTSADHAVRCFARRWRRAS
jgi:hypothetical protein